MHVRLINFIWFVILLSVPTLISITGCTLLRKVPNEAGGFDEVIQNSINDFTKTQLFKKGELFSVSFYDDFTDYKLINQSDNEYAWTPDKSYPNIYAVSILAHKMKFFYNPTDTETTKTNIPQCVLWKNGKLFYWWDEEKPLTESTINTFRELGLIEEKSYLLEFGSDDSQKAAHYFVCKNDVSKFKRKITNIGIGHYKPPKMKCK